MISADETPESGSHFPYEMVGDDGLTAEQRLEKYTGDVDWSYLKPHFKEGALIYVDPSLDLKAVGRVFLADEKEQVEAWLKCGDLVKPGELHAQWWESQGSRFLAQVVQPFVLIQPLEGQ